MLEIIDIAHPNQWDEIVVSFASHDVYYLSGYVRPFMLHGDGVPKLLYYEDGSLKAMYVFMLRHTDIEGLYDTTTPYGYGGILFDGEVKPQNVEVFWNVYLRAMNDLGIVDDFVRYSPVLRNAEYLRPYSNIIDLGKTIAIDLSSPETIWENLTSKKRGKIRKAEKNGIQIHHGRSLDLFEKFIPIYDATMDKDTASDYYYFDSNFFESIHTGLFDNYEMFYATLGDKIIMMAIMLHCNGQMHYHLSGSLLEYRNLEANNLLLYEAALWGCEHGLKTLHLGGGVGSAEDALYKFKEGFNRNESCQFSIGKQIFNPDGYKKLVEMRLSKDRDFNPSTLFFPVYRADKQIVSRGA